ARSWTRAGSTTSTRSARPARSFPPRSTSPAESPARSSTWRGWEPRSDRRVEQGSGGADLQGSDLRNRGRHLPDRAGGGESGASREGRIEQVVGTGLRTCTHHRPLLV